MGLLLRRNASGCCVLKGRPWARSSGREAEQEVTAAGGGTALGSEGVLSAGWRFSSELW